MILTIVHRFLATASLLLVALLVHAQDLEDLSLKHSMKQDGLSMQFTVLSPDKKGIRNYSSQKTYYWYKAQKVLGTQGGSSGQLLHGEFESHYASKQLCEKGAYDKGLKDGEWNYWYPNGMLMRREYWKKGLQKGRQLTYDANGNLVTTTIVRKRSVRSESGDSLVVLAGRSKTVTVYDSLGKPRSVTRYRSGLLHGDQETISGEERSVVTYKNGQQVVKTPGEPKEEKQSETAGQETKEGIFTKLKKRFAKKEKTDGKQSEEPVRREKKRDKEDPDKRKPSKKKQP